MSEQDYYQLLGLGRNCSSNEIRQSYKKLARKYHPDNKETGNEELFKKIGEAYSVLSDPQKKALYDRVGHEAFLQGGRGTAYNQGFDGSELFDDLQGVFDSFFGTSFGSGFARKRGRNRRERGADLQVLVELDFMDAAFGGSKKVKISRLITCQPCNGSGADPSVGTKQCTTCHGSGEIRHVTQSLLGMITQVSTCPACQGNGTMITAPCKACSGKGQTKQEVELEVKIPKGAEDGSRLVWTQKGNEGRNGGPTGDLYLLLKVKPHPRLKRQGLEIYEEMDVSVWQAIVGDEVEVETIHGPQKIEIKAGSQPNTIITLNSMGIKLDNGQAGNHHVKLMVKIPNKKDLPKNILEAIQAEVQDGEQKQKSSSFASFFNWGGNKE